MGEKETLKEAKERSKKEFEEFGGYSRMLDAKHKEEYKVYLSDNCNAVLKELLKKHNRI